MYPVTDGFQEEMRNPINRSVYGKVSIDYTNTELDESIIVTANEYANVSHPDQVSDGVTEPIGKILSLDGSWVLDGSFVFGTAPGYESKSQMGWWGETLSDSNGLFPDMNPKLTVEFKSRPMLDLNVIGDIFRGEFPVDFNVRYYSENLVVNTIEVRNNDSIGYHELFDSPITNIDKLELEVIKWNKPNRQVKILEFYTIISGDYGMEDIMEINLVEQRASQLTGLPIGSITNSEVRVKLSNEDGSFDVDNKQSPLYELLLPNRRVKPSIGVELENGEFEYIPLGTYWVDDWKINSDNNHVELIGRDRLKFLDEDTFSLDRVITDISIYDFVEMILVDFGYEDGDYVIDTFFKTMNIPVVNIVEEEYTHKEILRMLIEVSLGQIYVNRDDVLFVDSMFPLSEEVNVSTNDKNDISILGQVNDDIIDMQSNYMILNGSSTLSENNVLPNLDGIQQIGWVNNKLSNADGSFTQPYPSISLESMPRSITGVSITGDNYRNEYPVDFVINLYDDIDNILYTDTIINNNSMTYNGNIIGNFTNVAKLEVVISKWSKGNELIKISEVVDGAYKLLITEDDYFKMNTPLNYNSLANKIEVEVMPSTGGDSYYISKSNLESIDRLGVKKFTISGNIFIQNDEMANWIANKLLGIYGNPSRELDVDWRGNPALLLGDLVTMKGVDYRLYEQTIKYDGVIRGQFKGVVDYN